MARSMLAAVVVVTLVALCAATPLDEWRAYKLKHGKEYADRAEDRARFANFLATKQQVDAHNANPTKTYEMGLNELADHHQHELDRRNGLKLLSDGQIEPIESKFLDKINGLSSGAADLPDSVDWRTVANRVSKVKDQAECGSCWAFSITGMLEGQEVGHNFSKSLVPLSEQDLVDCSDHDFGCSGGNPAVAVKDIIKMGGIDSETDYPYKGVASDSCKHKNKTVMTLDDVKSGELSEDDIKKTVANYGPVSVCMAVVGNFFHYKNGVYQDKDCSSWQVNHAVLIVGYGTDKESNLDYWLVKNSWAEKWGEKGYFKILRGKNMCNINKLVTIGVWN